MANQGESQGRRNYERKKVQGVAFATLYKDEDMVLGQLLDICPAGLAFKYLPLFEDSIFNDLNLEGKEFNADIYLQDKDIFLEGIRCKLVYNQQCPKDHPLCMMHLNKCAVEFQALNAEQHEKLMQMLSVEEGIEEGRKLRK